VTLVGDEMRQWSEESHRWLRFRVVKVPNAVEEALLAEYLLDDTNNRQTTVGDNGCFLCSVCSNL
jgi:hypothetical protein